MRTGEIIYVGRTRHKPAQRFSSHKTNTKMNIGKFISSEGCHNFNITILKTCIEYNDYWSSEIPIIEQHNPKFNVRRPK